MEHTIDKPLINPIVLLSGGLDSVVLLHLTWLHLKQRTQHPKICALSFHYGQKNSSELLCAREHARKVGCKQLVIPLTVTDLYAQAGVSLIDDNIDVPKDRTIKEMTSEIPNTYVPARNLIFLSLATAYAEAVGSNAILFGACQTFGTQAEGYPDNRPAFVDAIDNTVKLATDFGNPPRTKLRQLDILAPFAKLTKAQVVRIAIELDIDLDSTLTCFQPIKNRACNSCDVCVARASAIEEAVTLPLPKIKLNERRINVQEEASELYEIGYLGITL